MPGTVLLIMHTRGTDSSMVEAALARRGFASERTCLEYGGMLLDAHKMNAASIIFGDTQRMTRAELRPYL